MKPRRPAVVLALALLLLAAASAACDSGGDEGAASGTATLRAGEGLDLSRGTLVAKGSFANSDLYATENGDWLRLATGGPTSAQMRPSSWLKTPGGVFQTFASLDAVPDGPKPTDPGNALQYAKPGQGFIVQTARGGYAKGWIAAADAASVTVQFAPVP